VFMCVRMFVCLMMVVSLRTGGMVIHSTTWLAIMAATTLPQDHPPPQVAGQFKQFFREWHGLVEIGQEVAKRFI